MFEFHRLPSYMLPRPLCALDEFLYESRNLCTKQAWLLVVGQLIVLYE